MKEQIKIRKMVGIGILLALSFIFGFIGNSVAIGPVSINLTLIPIALAALIYGPIEGMIMGLLSGLLVMLSPSTAIFISHNVIGTALIVFSKTALAGLIAGLTFRLLRKKNFAFAIILSSILIPIINTSIFGLGCYVFFYNLMFSSVSGNTFIYFCTVVVGFNFIFELAVNALLSPTLVGVIKTVTKNYNIGSQIN